MQQNPIYGSYNMIPAQPSAININVFNPQTYGGAPCACPAPSYSFYGCNPGTPYAQYPNNYNYPMQPYNGQNQSLNNNTMNMYNNNINQTQKTDNGGNNKNEKQIKYLDDSYIMSLENSLNDSDYANRLTAVKHLLDRFKEDESRKDNPSLNALLNKALRDSHPSVRFLALTILKCKFSVGNPETVQILNEIREKAQDKNSEDYRLTTDILLNLSAQQNSTQAQGVVL